MRFVAFRKRLSTEIDCEVSKLYCKNCGNEIMEKDTVCRHCRVKRGEGVDYCHVCGDYSVIKTDFCSTCGAKQMRIPTYEMKISHLKELLKSLKLHQKIMKVEKWCTIIGAVSLVILMIVFVGRPMPENIPDPSMSMSSNSFIHDSLLMVGDTYYYSSDISSEVVEYWVQSRNLLMYMGLAFLMFLSSLIGYFIEKKSYKKILNSIKEAKNVL